MQNAGRKLKNILVTGGSGFIGTNFIRYLFGLGSLKAPPGFDARVINLDAETYAARPRNLYDVAELFGARYVYEKGDIGDRALVETIFEKYEIDTVVHFAAESHVDRSIAGPEVFVRTNVLGTLCLLEAARTAWQGRDDVLFHHISTDEVYGSLGEGGYFFEGTAYDPRSPYSASKASSDHLVSAYAHTYAVPTTLSNCSNNFGPFQHTEKLIPLMIQGLRNGQALPVYGDGQNVRDWLFVEDHSKAVWDIIERAKTGSRYNIGGDNEWTNIKLVYRLIELVASKTGKPKADLEALVTFVKDRPGHDRRYAINCDKIKRELGWRQAFSFEEGLSKTVDWYLER